MGLRCISRGEDVMKNVYPALGNSFFPRLLPLYTFPLFRWRRTCEKKTQPVRLRRSFVDPGNRYTSFPPTSLSSTSLLPPLYNGPSINKLIIKGIRKLWDPIEPKPRDLREHFPFHSSYFFQMYPPLWKPI